MDKHRLAITAAAVLGVAAGSYGIASAASGNGTTTTTQSTTPSAPSTQTAPSAQQPWGHQRSDETLLTGDALSKVTQLAQSKVPGGTIIRVETDADGHAAYEAHMVKADGSLVTVYVSKQLEVVGVQSGMPHPPGGARLAPTGASA